MLAGDRDAAAAGRRERPRDRAPQRPAPAASWSTRCSTSPASRPGASRPRYEPTDLAAFTAELASVFRSAVRARRARLVVDCPPLPEPVYVDREMWEKIVLNLLSNAFKFTFAGRDRGPRWRRRGRRVELSVRDTGTGIPAERAAAAVRALPPRRGRARPHATRGAGIGLALVQELVRLHGGTIAVESEVGRGTTFTVTIPHGHGAPAAGPHGRRGSRRSTSTATSADAFVEEALRWLPDEPRAAEVAQRRSRDAGRATVRP